MGKIVFAGVLCCCCMAAYGQVVEVNQNDPGAMYQRITNAVNEVPPGTTILVHPGTYEEFVTISGVKLQALRGPEVTVIKSPDGHGTGVTITGNQQVELIGFRVQGFVTGIYVNASETIKIANCITDSNAENGFSVSTSVPLNTRIMNNIAANNGGNGFYVSRYKVTYTAINNNISFQNGQYGYCDNGTSPYYDPTVFGSNNSAFGNTSGATNRGPMSIGANPITSDPLLNVNNFYRFINMNSPCVNAGHPGDTFKDPDGTLNDMGAFGGPYAANWWRDPFGGPTIELVTIDPPQVQPGGTVTIRATAKTE